MISHYRHLMERVFSVSDILIRDTLQTMTPIHRSMKRSSSA